MLQERKASRAKKDIPHMHPAESRSLGAARISRCSPGKRGKREKEKRVKNWGGERVQREKCRSYKPELTSFSLMPGTTTANEGRGRQPEGKTNRSYGKGDDQTEKKTLLFPLAARVLDGRERESKGEGGS